jgi:hypothetical protein
MPLTVTAVSTCAVSTVALSTGMQAKQEFVRVQEVDHLARLGIQAIVPIMFALQCTFNRASDFVHGRMWQ